MQPPRAPSPRRPVALARHFNRGHDLVENRIWRDAFDLGLGAQQDAVAQGRVYYVAHVIWRHEIAPAHRGQGLARQQHGHRRARARAPEQARVFAGAPRQIQQVRLHSRFDSRVADHRAASRDDRRVVDRDEIHGFEPARVEARLPIADDLQFVVETRAGDQNLEQEAVELRLGQRVGAFVFDRVFGGQHQEHRREAMAFAVDRHLPFLHRLEQRGLRLRRRAVDLVGQQNVGEDGAVAQRELRRGDVEDVGPGDVRRHQVWRELNAIEVGADDPRDGFDRQSLRGSGRALQDRVSFGEEADQDLVDYSLLTEDDFLRFTADVCGDLADILSHAI